MLIVRANKNKTWEYLCDDPRQRRLAPCEDVVACCDGSQLVRVGAYACATCYTCLEILPVPVIDDTGFCGRLAHIWQTVPFIRHSVKVKFMPGIMVASPGFGITVSENFECEDHIGLSRPLL
jgi:hypothetical protein